jgi:hypothetical protein
MAKSSLCFVCVLCLSGFVVVNNHRDTENTEEAPRRGPETFLLTPENQRRSIRSGWPKVVGSGSNLVANRSCKYSFPFQPPFLNFSPCQRDAPGKLHGTD